MIRIPGRLALAIVALSLTAAFSGCNDKVAPESQAPMEQKAQAPTEKKAKAPEVEKARPTEPAELEAGAPPAKAPVPEAEAPMPTDPREADAPAPELTEELKTCIELYNTLIECNPSMSVVGDVNFRNAFLDGCFREIRADFPYSVTFRTCVTTRECKELQACFVKLNQDIRANGAAIVQKFLDAGAKNEALTHCWNQRDHLEFNKDFEALCAPLLQEQDKVQMELLKKALEQDRHNHGSEGGGHEEGHDDHEEGHEDHEEGHEGHNH